MRLIGLEPTQLALLDPKSSASTNFATGACGGVCSSLKCGCKGSDFFEIEQEIYFFFNNFEKKWKKGEIFCPFVASNECGEKHHVIGKLCCLFEIKKKNNFFHFVFRSACTNFAVICENERIIII